MSEHSAPLDGMDVLILAGGMGTRISAVLGDVPKLLAPIEGTPYLYVTAHWLGRFGAKRLILCLGHLADKISAYVNDHSFKDMTLELSVETEPLGTAGAIRHAKPYIMSDEILVINGDTWIDANLGDFVSAHRRCGLDISILCAEVDDISRYARINIAPNGHIISYREKDPSLSGSGIISAGIYLFSNNGLKQVLDSTGPSLEHDFFQQLPTGMVHGYVATGRRFIDIGTPQSLKEAAWVLPLSPQQDKDS